MDRSRSRFPAILDRRIAQKFTPVLGAAVLICAGSAFGLDFTQQSAAQSANPAEAASSSARTPVFNTKLAQSETSSIDRLIPVPEPANVPPPTKADIEREQGEQAAPPMKTNATSAKETAPAQIYTGKDLVKAPIASSLASADIPVAEKLRELLANRADRFFSRKADRTAAETFYRDRGFAPLWIEKGQGNARAAAAIAHLKSADADGLYPADYQTPDFKALNEPGALAEAELKLTVSAFDYARHAQIGRVHFSRISGDIFYPQVAPEPAEILTRLTEAKNAGEALAGYLPQHEGYRALKAKLAELRGRPGAEPEIIRIPEGPSLKPGMDDPRVLILRKRLDIPGDKNSTRYDNNVAEAIKGFQRNAGISPDGVMGAGTVRVLNGRPQRTNQIDTLVANLERWRWMPRDLGKVYSMLNIPDFTVKVVRNGAPVWQTKVVVGKASTQTPVFSDSMKFITVNPIWNVPASIIANEYLPALRQDPQVLTRMGLKVEENHDGTVRIYQPPGDGNALGRLRFNFPNKFTVYQHDTPDKNLFDKQVRAYSHGCMRVQDPVKYAEVLLSIVLPKEGYTQDRIRRMFGNSEQNINFPTPLPVHITYQTAFVDDAGKLQIRDDVYSHDAHLLAALKDGERRFADIPIERRHVAVNRDELRLPSGLASSYGRSTSVEDFFRRLFR